MVSQSDSRPGGCEFDPGLRRLFFPAYFRLSPLQKHVRKVNVGRFGHGRFGQDVLARTFWPRTFWPHIVKKWTFWPK